MTIAAPNDLASINRSYALILEAQALLESTGHDDIAVLLFHALGEMEDRFDLASVEELEAMSASKNMSSRSS